MNKPSRPEPLPLDVRNAVLAASMEPSDRDIRRADALVWRWLPWLLSFSGARASEIIVAQGDDFLETCSDGEANVACLRVRTDSAVHRDRLTPIHPGLIEMGLLDMARQHIGQYPFLDDRPFTDIAVQGALARYGRRLRKTEIGANSVAPTPSGFRRRFVRELVHANATSTIIDTILGRSAMPSRFDDGTGAVIAGAAALGRIPMPAIEGL